MSTRRQRRANRRNAQHSTGPTSPEGKARSAQNAASHGLSSSFAVLPHEDRSAYEQLLETNRQEFTPTTEHESFLVAQMTQARWRLERTRRFEAIAYGQLLDEVDKSNPNAVIVEKLTARTTNVFDLLQRYATAAERSYYKAHRELTAGRTSEKRNEANQALAGIKAQLQRQGLPVPPVDHPIWCAPAPAIFENEQNEPKGTAGTAANAVRGVTG